ncbi:MAG TPA: hypothetical protein VMT98_15635 [Verrucomicrobiae bacterium]|jgi:hypothetical protein|nr:hypothetical protein [Verrucomicrobiae bacterium]
MTNMKAHTVVLVTAMAAVTAAIALAGSSAFAAESTKLTGCRYEAYDPATTPRCSHEEAALHISDPPPPMTTPPPEVIYSIHTGEGGKNEHESRGIGGARTDRDAAGKPK